MEKEIQIINKIIMEAIWHGADAGGSYDQNERRLTNAVNEWLELKGLTNQYKVCVVNSDDIPNKTFNQDMIQIIKR